MIKFPGYEYIQQLDNKWSDKSKRINTFFLVKQALDSVYWDKQKYQHNIKEMHRYDQKPGVKGLKEEQERTEAGGGGEKTYGDGKAAPYYTIRNFRNTEVAFQDVKKLNRDRQPKVSVWVKEEKDEKKDAKQEEAGSRQGESSVSTGSVQTDVRNDLH